MDVLMLPMMLAADAAMNVTQQDMLMFACAETDAVAYGNKLRCTAMSWQEHICMSASGNVTGVKQSGGDSC